MRDRTPIRRLGSVEMQHPHSGLSIIQSGRFGGRTMLGQHGLFDVDKQLKR